MTGELSWDDILDRYSSEIKGEQPYEESFRENRSEMDTDNLREEFKSEYQAARENSKHRKRLLSTVVGAFIEEGPIEEATQWSFDIAKPLGGILDTPADLVVGKRPSGSVILIVVVRLRERPETSVSRASDIYDTVQNHIDTLSDQVDYQVYDDEVQVSIVVEETRDEPVAGEISDSDDEIRDNLYLWVVDSEDDDDYMWEYGDLVATGHHNHGGLHSFLDNEIYVPMDSTPIPDFYSESHHEILAQHCIMKMADKDGAPSTHFSERQLKEYIKDELAVPEEYNLGADIASECLIRWKWMGLIEERNGNDDRIEDGSQAYRFETNKQNPNTIRLDLMEDYMQKTVDMKIDVEALREVVRKYDEEEGVQSTLNGGPF